MAFVLCTVFAFKPALFSQLCILGLATATSLFLSAYRTCTFVSIVFFLFFNLCFLISFCFCGFQCICWMIILYLFPLKWIWVSLRIDCFLYKWRKEFFTFHVIVNKLEHPVRSCLQYRRFSRSTQVELSSYYLLQASSKTANICLRMVHLMANHWFSFFFLYFSQSPLNNIKAISCNRYS